MKKDTNQSQVAFLFSQRSIQLMHLVSVVIVFLVPQSVIENSKLLLWYATTMANYIPLVENFTVRSSYPGLMRFYTAVMVLFIPAGFLAFQRYPGNAETIKRILIILSSSVFKVLLAHFAILLFTATTISVFIWITPSQWNLVPFHTSKMVLAIGGPAMVVLVPAGIAQSTFLLITACARFWKGDRRG